MSSWASIVPRARQEVS